MRRTPAPSLVAKRVLSGSSRTDSVPLGFSDEAGPSESSLALGWCSVPRCRILFSSPTHLSVFAPVFLCVLRGCTIHNQGGKPTPVCFPGLLSFSVPTPPETLVGKQTWLTACLFLGLRGSSVDAEHWHSCGSGRCSSCCLCVSGVQGAHHPEPKTHTEWAL